MANDKGNNAIEAAPNDVEAINNTPSKKKFPTPQYLVTIYSKNVVLVDRDDADELTEKNWNQNLVAG